MAGNLNRVFLMGNLTRDVELRHVSGNQAVANIGLAVNRRWKTPEGENREETTFVDCEAWGRTAEVMAQYLAKGRPVFIEGRLKLDQWEKEGQKFSKLRVVVESFQFVDSREGGGGGGGGGGGRSSQGGSRQGSSSSSSAPAPANVADDDIPF
ncbi:MAG: single-stranded DNA-binding protein [Phycisphaerales bacterium]|jgi:single-strand DNA-binding protein|nr:single-stranded DNA-binding protein [Phycisphaerales bacterium]NUQ53150.1 single-stranded DNA-binding protein [Phycisphaerales bacterium]